jgi:hypothetical protein
MPPQTRLYCGDSTDDSVSKTNLLTSRLALKMFLNYWLLQERKAEWNFGLKQISVQKYPEYQSQVENS